jgi:DNA-directed RNA polymerase subunit RPC12/RpoP
MPIRFRCPHCERLLGIARRKAGSQIHCPQCGESVLVPGEDDGGDRMLREVDELLGPPAVNGTAASPPPEPTQPVFSAEFQFAAAPLHTPPPARPISSPKRKTPGDNPLFEQGSVDALLGIVRPDEALNLDEEPKVRPISGLDALSLEEKPGTIILSPQKATLLVIAAAVLMLLAFAAGFFIGSQG